MTRNKIDEIIKKTAKTREEQDELLLIVEEMVHHRIMGCVLDNLPQEYHGEFLEKMSGEEASERMIEYLEEKSGKEISEKIRKAASEIEAEILQEIA